MTMIEMFIADKTAMNQAKVLTTLGMTVRSGGEIVSRSALIESRISQGFDVVSVQVIDEKWKNRVLADCARLQKSAPTGNERHPQTIKLRGLQARIKENDFYVMERRLISTEGNFFTAQELTKTGMDYAEHVLASTQR